MTYINFQIESVVTLIQYTMKKKKEKQILSPPLSLTHAYTHKHTLTHHATPLKK